MDKNTPSGISELITRLRHDRTLTDPEFAALIEYKDELPALTAAADEVRRSVYGDAVFLRGLIEFTNICKNDCYYCGIRCGNKKVERYRLSCEDILSCCDTGYALGYRTFVLQGGEDPYFSTDRLCRILDRIRSKYPDCMITLSVGERSKADYKAFFDAGAGRYLLRHETMKQKTAASVFLPIIFTCFGHGERIMPRTPRRKPFIPGSWKPYRSKPKWNICWIYCCSGRQRKKRL